MGSFAGIVVFDGAPTVRRTEEILAAATIRNNGTSANQVGRTPHAFFVASHPPDHPSGTRLFAAVGRLDNPEQIAAQNNCAPGTPDEILIRQSFERRGDTGIAGLLGAFAFAHWDEQSAALTLASDCLGRRGLFYHRGR